MTKISREKEYWNKKYDKKKREIRSPRSKYYSITDKSINLYYAAIEKYCRGKKVLVIGSGVGLTPYVAAKIGSQSVVGIDISSVIIEQSKIKVQEEQLPNLEFREMNAESLEFPDCSFDCVIGAGVLHHLNIEKAYIEIVRVLKSNGKAIFIEPLGHNPLINMYRKLTPEMRTIDEHPLVERDLQMAREFFHNSEKYFFHLFSLCAILFRKFGFYNSLVDKLDSIDQKLFKLFPFMKKYAWMVLLILSDPVRYYSDYEK